MKGYLALNNDLPSSFEHDQHTSGFPQRKEAKENKGQKSIAYRTVARVAHNSQSSIATHNNIIDSTSIAKTQTGKRSAAIKNAEIDEYIKTLVMEGIVDPKFTAWVAKCIHTLSLRTVNELVVNSRNGRDKQKLLAYKLNGALQLHHKNKYLSID